jgi:aspartate carbamoyltransferase catalytic subunit
MFEFSRRHLLSIHDLSVEEILHLLELSERFYEFSRRAIKKAPALRGKTVINLFLEPSTRTRTSFELAAKRLSADVINVSAAVSSTKKGESLKDTVQTIDAMQADLIVVRHSSSGAAHFVARNVNASVINAGDGMHEHPTQALLDCATIKRRFGYFKGLKVTIVGDVAHSRVARSNIGALTRLGAEVHIAGPLTLMPAEITSLGVHYHLSIDAAIRDAHVVMVLRLQRERQEAGLIPNLREYARHYGVNAERLSLAKEDGIVMHPGPMNRGVEIDSAVADGAQSVILEQVELGVATRMSLLFWLMNPSGDSANLQSS